jgi:hypothetical protein
MDILKSNIAVGIGVAVVATAIAPVIIPVIATVGRPLAKSFIKGGLMLYEKSREAVAGAGEVMEDLIAEVRAEEMNRRSASVAAGTPDARQSSAQTPDAARSQRGNGSEKKNNAQHESTRVEPRAENGLAT